MAPDVPYPGTRIVCALRIETEVKRANTLHSNGDIQMNFPQITAISAKMGVELTAIQQMAARGIPMDDVNGPIPGKLPFEMMSAGRVELK
jgi:hypothetical protein